ncbi:MAG: hypothetical protein KAX09_02125 [Candidatus Heimdallarchaeota archaeon]|nr:hypothetical protein [Candidatus Heimdallarchaeota archaeon]MCK4289758.1 hypothetical protein [Candidatus Heimdallarchaeota archaeon]
MLETSETQENIEDVPQESELQSYLEQEIFVEPKRKVTWRSFIRISGFTITFVSLALISMIIGLVMYYGFSGTMVRNAGFWIIFVGVGLFLLTIIFGFERVD